MVLNELIKLYVDKNRSKRKKGLKLQKKNPIKQHIPLDLPLCEKKHEEVKKKSLTPTPQTLPCPCQPPCDKSCFYCSLTQTNAHMINHVTFIAIFYI